MGAERPLALVEIVGRLPYASNTTLLALDGDGTAWVYKPARGEEPLWDFPWGTLAAREILSYEVGRAMGLDIIPETVEAVGEFGAGSAQRYVDEDATFDPRPLFEPRLSDRLWPYAVFDIVSNNADRKVGHVLCDTDGRLWAIDNGLTFHHHEKLRTVLWGFAGRRLPEPLVTAVERLAGALEEDLCERITELLSAREAEALTRRVAALLELPVHPLPPDDRPAVPWPVW